MTKKDNPLVSIIIPAYNHELYIEEALQSVIDQTYSNIELIVINDGSTDGTAQVITDFIGRHQNYNIQYHSKNNEGVCRTLNKGLEMAHGSYFALLASDDMWLPERIEKQVLFMEQNKSIGLVFTDHYFVKFREITNIKATDYKPNIRKCFKNGIQNANIYETLLIEDIIPALTVLIRKECFDKVGGFDNNLKAEDYDMWLRISKEFPIAFIDEPLAYYRVHDTNVSNKTMSLQTLRTIRTIMKKQYNEQPLKNQYTKKAFLFFRFWFTVIRNRIIRVFVIEKK